ncbi:MAG: TatD family hydrolase [Fibrobacter sp.]|jgi:TatD DNase family protein|nr:TatD family hydrolase [Fibrobacter sp.]
MDYFDNHIHIARLPEPLEVARELHERDYKYRAVACEPWEWKAVKELWEKASAEGWQNGCGFSFGLHPMVAADIASKSSSDDCWSEMRHLLKAFPDAQVGEAGLDKRYAGYEPGGTQEEVFRRQAKMALEFGRDLQIHCVGDYGRVVKILREVGFSDVRTGDTACGKCVAGVKRSRPIFHRFGGDAGIVKAGKPLGAIFSIHADSFRKKATREALALIPAESLRFETDADETFVRDNTETPQEVADRLVKALQDTIESI